MTRPGAAVRLRRCRAAVRLLATGDRLVWPPALRRALVAVARGAGDHQSPTSHRMWRAARRQGAGAGPGVVCCMWLWCLCRLVCA